MNIAIAPILNRQITSNGNGPPPPFFNITIIVPDNIPDRVLWANLVETQLELIGIGVDIHLVTFAEAMNRIWVSPIASPIPVYDDGGYDAVLIGFLWTSPEWHPNENFGAEWPPNGLNHYQYSSSLFDSILLLHNATCLTTDRIPYAHQLQEILFEDLPSIPIVYPRYAYPMLDTIHPMDLCLWHNDRQPMDMWSDDADSTLVYANLRGFEECHPYSSDMMIYDQQWLKQIYDSLIYITNCTNMHWAPRIATSYTMHSCTNWTVEIDPNAKWADGTAVTADDVVFSYQAMINPALNSQYQWIGEYLDPTSILAVDPTTVAFFLTEHCIHFESILGLPLIPKHIWQPTSEGGTGPEYADWWTQAADWAENDPSKIFGCGPFQLQLANSSSWTLILEKNNYFADLTNFDGPILEYIHFNNFTSKTDALYALEMGQVEIVDTRYKLELSDFNTILGTTYEVAKSTLMQEMGINMLHPYLGTGADCPIPGPESAKHIRKAICNAIPRQDIIDNILDGLGAWGIAPCPEGCIEFSPNILPCDLSIVDAKDHMRDAGFVYPEDTTTTSPTETPTETETETPTETSTPTSNGTTGFLGITLPILLTIFALVGGCAIIVMKRRRK